MQWRFVLALSLLAAALVTATGTPREGETGRLFDRIEAFAGTEKGLDDGNEDDQEESFLVSVVVLAQERNTFKLRGCLSTLRQMLERQDVERIRQKIRNDLETPLRNVDRGPPLQLPSLDFQVLVVPVIEPTAESDTLRTWSLAFVQILEEVSVSSFPRHHSLSSPSISASVSLPWSQCALSEKEPEEDQERKEEERGESSCASESETLIKRERIGHVKCPRQTAEEIKGLAGALNWGLKRSKGMFVLFAMDDVLFETGNGNNNGDDDDGDDLFLFNMIKHLNHPLQPVSIDKEGDQEEEGLDHSSKNRSTLQAEWREYHRLVDAHLFDPDHTSFSPIKPKHRSGTGIVSCAVFTDDNRVQDIGIDFQRVSIDEDITGSPDISELFTERFPRLQDDNQNEEQERIVNQRSPFVWFPFPRLQGVERERKETKHFSTIKASSHHCWMAPRQLLVQARGIADVSLFGSSRSSKWKTNQQLLLNHPESMHFSVIDLCMRLRLHGWDIGWIPESRVIVNSVDSRSDYDRRDGLRVNSFGRNFDADVAELHQTESMLQKKEAKHFITRWNWFIQWDLAETFVPSLDAIRRLDPSLKAEDEDEDEDEGGGEGERGQEESLKDVWNRWKRWQKMKVVWRSECGAGQVLGFTMEALTIVLKLDTFIPIALANNDVFSCIDSLTISMGLPRWQIASLDRLSKGRWFQWTDYILVLHHDPGRYEAFLHHHASGVPSYVIGRSMYETNNIPSDWIEPLRDHIDELWVPSVFNLWTFGLSLGMSGSDLLLAASQSVSLSSFDPTSLERDISLGPSDDPEANPRIFVLPEAVDTHVFDPETFRVPLSSFDSSSRPFRFLSIMKWEERKGWKDLIRAFLSAFSPSEVSLSFFLSLFLSFPNRLID